MSASIGGLAMIDNSNAGVTRTRTKRVRDRIFDTACRLFYEHGIRAVGVDAIAHEAGTNKMSFYRNFASKEELVASYLRAQAEQHFCWWDETIAQHAGNPRRQAEALFDAYAAHARADCPRGCALANAAVELAPGDGALDEIVREYKAEIRRRLRRLAREMGAADPNLLGDALMLLMEGGYASRLSVKQEAGPLTAAAAAARALIDAQLPRGRRSGPGKTRRR